MIDDLQHGTRNKRGDWKPSSPIALPPLARSNRTINVAGWLLSFVWPWNLITLGLTVLLWSLAVPSIKTMQTLSLGWIVPLFLTNWLALFAWFGGWEFVLYRKRVQGRRFKYNGAFPSDKPAAYFWFNDQNIDNFIRSMFISVPIVVAMEVCALWLFANGWGSIEFVTEHPILFALLLVFIPILHEAYFFFVHWFMHWEPFYQWCHSIHHNSINPSPWTSMSNHPVETVLQFLPSVIWIPLCPFLALYHLNTVAFSSVLGHIGFEKIEINDKAAWSTHAYPHYLHHKHFDVNYCDDGYLPWDRWFGTWHDGTAEGEQLMQERFKTKAARKNSRTA